MDILEVQNQCNNDTSAQEALFCFYQDRDHKPTHSLNLPTSEFEWHHPPRNPAHWSLQPLWKETQTKFLISQVGCWDADTLRCAALHSDDPWTAKLTSLELAVNNASTPMHLHPACSRQTFCESLPQGLAKLSSKNQNQISQLLTITSKYSP